MDLRNYFSPSLLQEGETNFKVSVVACEITFIGFEDNP